MVPVIRAKPPGAAAHLQRQDDILVHEKQPVVRRCMLSPEFARTDTTITGGDGRPFRPQSEACRVDEMKSLPMKLWSGILQTSPLRAVVLIRLMVGAVFLSEGIQKFLYPASVGAGRFARIGLPAPEFTASFVATFEIACGLLILSGLLTRLAVIPTTIIMLVAISTTKVPILLNDGFWKMAHESRTDWSMLLGSIFLLIVGAGRWSLDWRLAERFQLRPRRG